MAQDCRKCKSRLLVSNETTDVQPANSVLIESSNPSFLRVKLMSLCHLKWLDKNIENYAYISFENKTCSILPHRTTNGLPTYTYTVDFDQMTYVHLIALWWSTYTNIRISVTYAHHKIRQNLLGVKTGEIQRVFSFQKNHFI